MFVCSFFEHFEVILTDQNIGRDLLTKHTLPWFHMVSTALWIDWFISACQTKHLAEIARLIPVSKVPKHDQCRDTLQQLLCIYVTPLWSYLYFPLSIADCIFGIMDLTEWGLHSKMEIKVDNKSYPDILVCFKLELWSPSVCLTYNKVHTPLHFIHQKKVFIDT